MVECLGSTGGLVVTIELDVRAEWTARPGQQARYSVMGYPPSSKRRSGCFRRFLGLLALVLAAGCYDGSRRKASTIDALNASLAEVDPWRVPNHIATGSENGRVHVSGFCMCLEPCRGRD